MACVSITDYMTRESGRFLERGITNRVFGQSLWMTLTPRDTHPTGLSEVLNVLQIERTAPYDVDDEWTPVVTIDGAEGGACLPPVHKIETGSTTRSLRLFKRAIEGPDFCAEDFRTVFSLSRRLNGISRAFAEYIRLNWERRDRNEYFRLVKHKVIVDGCPPTKNSDALETWDAVATAEGATCPTSQLTQGILDTQYIRLLHDGAVPAARDGNGNPLLALVADHETLDGLIRNNEDIRQDFRWARPLELLRGLGISRAYRNFVHMADLYPNRYECSGGTYTKVATFAQSLATIGKKAEVNTPWETATLTESYIHSRSVLTQLVPAPVVAPAPNFTFSPVNYTGTLRAINKYDRKCNPDENIIFHRMVMAASSMPENVEHGMAFIHLRCDPPCKLITTCVTT